MEKQQSVRSKKIILIVSAVAVLAFLCAYIAFLISSYGSGSLIAKGVTINGVDVGGMTQESAKTALLGEIEQYGENTIDLIMDDNHTVATFAEFSIDYKVDEAVEHAFSYGKEKNLFSKIAHCFNISRGNANFDCKAEIDTEVVSDHVYAYSQTIGSTVVENSYLIENEKLKLINGKTGDGIDKELIIREIIDILKTGKSGKIGISLTRIDPMPYNVENIYADICKGPVNAGSEVRDGKKHVVVAANGYKFVKGDLEKLIKDNINNTEPYYLELEVIPPQVKTLNETGLFTELLAEYTSSLAGSSYNRKTNVALAASSVNGTILNPDEVFSYNKTVGDVTAATGYLPATIFTAKGHESGIGGGICQVSSTLYCAALYANLDIVKRRNHTYIVGYVPYGQDATVYEGELDFRFKNNTNEPLKIVSYVSGGNLIVRLLGKKVDPDITVEIENIIIARTPPETITKEDPEVEAGTIEVIEKGTIGLTVDTYKNIYKNGELISREKLHTSTYKPISRIEVHGTKPVVPAQGEPVDPNAPVDVPTNPEIPSVPETPPTDENYEGI